MSLIISPEQDGDELQRKLRQLTPLQIHYAIALFYSKNEKEAREATSLGHQTTSSWSEEVHAIIQDIVVLMASKAVDLASELLSQALVWAVQVKISGLQSDNEEIRQRVAKEIIEWQMGKAKAKLNVEIDRTGFKTYHTVSPDDWDDEGEGK